MIDQNSLKKRNQEIEANHIIIVKKISFENFKYNHAINSTIEIKKSCFLFFNFTAQLFRKKFCFWSLEAWSESFSKIKKSLVINLMSPSFEPDLILFIKSFKQLILIQNTKYEKYDKLECVILKKTIKK
ncbi:hypothetical protein BpHYR1_051651 [Brachionus plicatilis]|uniref:Uncharacterized protein n=1 Tax=Brachionus plicatilis TaxID=10195 RepID=A0A3M7QYV9_BRAPC|nr:hypothetical protein BpHYR1_051651 [Brachionus plicatilis]